jgi:membrane associated rhomboid family serine protease
LKALPDLKLKAEESFFASRHYTGILPKTCPAGVLPVTFGLMRPAPKWTEFARYPVIGGIALLAIAVTIAWWSKVNVSPLFETAMIRRGELWRLITGTLPHANILHLLFNIYWLWVFGTVVEQVYGHFRTAALVVFLALGSGSLEFAFALGGVGLSGVVYAFSVCCGCCRGETPASVTLLIRKQFSFSLSGSFFASQ